MWKGKRKSVRNTGFSILILAVAAIVAACLDLHSAPEIVVVKGGKILPVSQPEMDGASILIENGKIRRIGRNIPVPAGAEVISAENCWILPGMIDAHSHLGLNEEGRPAAIDEVSTPNAAALTIADGINPFDKRLKQVSRSGVTASLVTSGRANVIGGQPAVVKTRGTTVTEMTLLSPAGVKFSLGEGPQDAFGDKGRLPSTRMGSAYVVRDALIKAGEYRRKQQAYEEKKAKAEREGKEAPEPPDRDLALETLARLLDGRKTAFIECYRVDDIMTALRLTDEFKLKSVLIGATEGYRVAGEIARRGVPVIVGPMGIGPKRVETEDVEFGNAAVLAKAGVKVVIQADDALGIGTIEQLPLAAALAVKGGLDPAEAIRAITLNAAEVLGVADRIGSLDPGKDADLVIFDGDPLDYRTRVVRVLIDGKTIQ